MSDTFEKMDKMYRYQRYFYDLTRKYYLLGRDRLIDEMAIKSGDNILEIGCGTGRNLAILAKKYPESNFFGLDASAAMIETAEGKIKSKSLSNVFLKVALADKFAFDATFGLTDKFDAVFFSYSISMIPPWRESVDNALENLRSGGVLYFVDFYDQNGLPPWFGKMLTAWLRMFHVKYPADLIPYLRILEAQNAGKLTLFSFFKGYSFVAKFEKS